MGVSGCGGARWLYKAVDGWCMGEWPASWRRGRVVGRSGCPGFDQSLTHALDAGECQSQRQQWHDEVQPGWRQPALGNEQAQQAEDESAVALAAGAVVAARGADHQAKDTAELGKGGQEDHHRHGKWLDTGQEGEGDIERRIGHHIGELIEVGAQRGLLAVFAGQHAVDGVEAHAQQHPDGQQQEEPRVAGAPDTESDAHQQREAASQQGDLVGGGAAMGQGLNTRPQQALEAGFELVDGDHDAPAVCHVGRKLGRSVTDEGEIVCDGWPGWGSVCRWPA